MAATVRQIVDAAIEYMGEVAGPGVQQYSEDRVFAGVVRGFDMLFKKRRWRNYRKWMRLQLDGVNGLVIENTLQNVLDLEDFIGIFRDNTTMPLSIMPVNYNPYSLSTTGTRVQFWDSLPVDHANYNAKKLRFYPLTSIDFININAMVYPLDIIAENWDWGDYMYLDKDLLMYAGAVASMAGDDLNANAVALAQSAMQTRYEDIVARLSDAPIPIVGSTGVPNQWYVRP